MSKTKIIVAMAALASLSSVAAADGYDASLKDVASPSAVNWSGLYLGGQVGYGWGDMSSNHDLDVDFDAHDNFLNGIGQDFKGWMGGGHIGVQHQHGKWVFGIEGTYDAMNLDGSSSSAWSFGNNSLTGIVAPVAPPGGILTGPPGIVGPVVPPGGILEEQQAPMANGFSGVGTRSLRTGIDNLITITGRVGYTWDRWLAYVKGGYARAEVGVSGNVEGTHTGPCNAGCPAPINVSVFGNRQKDHDGWTVGAGAAYMLQKNVTLGFEYDYVKLTSETYTFDGILDTGFLQVPTTGMVDVDPDAIHAVSARLSIFFNQ